MKNNDLEKMDKPDYKECVNLVTKFALKEMLLPALSPIIIVLFFLLMNYLYKIHPLIPAPIVLGITSITAISSIRLVQKKLFKWSIALFSFHLLIIICCFGYIYKESNGISCNNGNGYEVTSFDYYYFSMVTWTTLGYGDFHPVNELQFVAAFEAFMGFIYMGILIALIWKWFETAQNRT